VEEDKWGRPDDLEAWTSRGKDMDRFRKDYWDLPETFNPTRFDPRAWARAARAAGMRYVVFTTKHHDGFSMYDTKLTDYRITGPGVPFRGDPRADAARQVFDAFHAEGMGIGAYFSKADWHSPDYWDPASPARTRNPNYDTKARPEKWARFVILSQTERLIDRHNGWTSAHV
jgi:alpha-L-fucosidase